jgi:hypothetical protein
MRVGSVEWRCDPLRRRSGPSAAESGPSLVIPRPRNRGISDTLAPGFLSNFAIFRGQGGVDSWGTASIRNGRPVVRRGRKARGLERSRRPSYRRRFVVRKKIWLQALVASAVGLMLFPGTASAASRVEVTTGGGSPGSTPRSKRGPTEFRCASLHLLARAKGNSGRAAASGTQCPAPTGAESTHPQDLRLRHARGRGSPPWSSMERGWHPSASPSSFETLLAGPRIRSVLAATAALSGMHRTKMKVKGATGG